jgi:FkbM family methyltransferase
MDKLDTFKGLHQFVLFGVGDARLPVEELLRSLGREIIAYSDNNTRNIGQKINDKPVVAPDELPRLSNEQTGIIISSSYQSEIARQLIFDLKVDQQLVFPYVTEMFLPSFGGDSDPVFTENIDRLLSILADDDSREYVSSLVEFRRSMNPLALRRNPRVTDFYDYDTGRPFYFDGMVAVDVGAYIGDTIAHFMRKVRPSKILAFEGLKSNFEALEKWVKSENIDDVATISNAFLGAAPGKVHMNSMIGGVDPRATSRSVGGAGDIVDVSTLDNMLLRELQIDNVDLIKIDVEGADLDVLRGASSILTKSKPAVMVAAYHQKEHIFEIPFYIKALIPDAKIYAGHHDRCVYEIEYFIQ